MSCARLSSRILAVLVGLRAVLTMLTMVGLTSSLNYVDISISTQEILLILVVYFGSSVLLWFKGTKLSNRIKCDNESCFGISDVVVVSLILLYLGIYILIEGIFGTASALINSLTIGPTEHVWNIGNIAQEIAKIIIGFVFLFFSQTLTRGLSRNQSKDYLTKAVGNGFTVLGFWIFSKAVSSLVGIVVSGFIQISTITGVAYTRFGLMNFLISVAMFLLGIYFINRSNRLAQAFMSH